MNCPHCGASNLPNAVFCSSCATNLATARASVPVAAVVAEHTSGMAIAGFVLSFFCSVLGLIFSIIGYNECKRSGGAVKGQGLALAGIIISSAVFVIGILAAVAIPAFMDYMKSAGSTEARVNLRRLGVSAKTAFITNAQFPVAHEGLTPATPCCDQRGHRCNDESVWQAPAWRALDFEVLAPHRFQYSYDSDGTSVDATAVGDPDCKGRPVTYHLHIEVRDGSPVMSVSGPER